MLKSFIHQRYQLSFLKAQRLRYAARLRSAGGAV